MTRNANKHMNRAKRDGIWLKFEENEELDPRKLSRALLAIALHRVERLEAEREAEAESGGRKRDGRS